MFLSFPVSFAQFPILKTPYYIYIYIYIYVYVYAPPWGLRSGEGIFDRRSRNAKLFKRIENSGSQ